MLIYHILLLTLLGRGHTKAGSLFIEKGVTKFAVAKAHITIPINFKQKIEKVRELKNFLMKVSSKPFLKGSRKKFVLKLQKKIESVDKILGQTILMAQKFIPKSKRSRNFLKSIFQEGLKILSSTVGLNLNFFEKTKDLVIHRNRERYYIEKSIENSVKTKVEEKISDLRARVKQLESTLDPKNMTSFKQLDSDLIYIRENLEFFHLQLEKQKSALLNAILLKKFPTEILNYESVLRRVENLKNSLLKRGLIPIVEQPVSLPVEIGFKEDTFFIFVIIPLRKINDPVTRARFMTKYFVTGKETKAIFRLSEYPEILARERHVPALYAQPPMEPGASILWASDTENCLEKIIKNNIEGARIHCSVQKTGKSLVIEPVNSYIVVHATRAFYGQIVCKNLIKSIKIEAGSEIRDLGFGCTIKIAGNVWTLSGHTKEVGQNTEVIEYQFPEVPPMDPDCACEWGVDIIVAGSIGTASLTIHIIIFVTIICRKFNHKIKISREKTCSTFVCISHV